MARRLSADTLLERTAYPEGPLSNEKVGPLSIAVRLSRREYGRSPFIATTAPHFSSPPRGLRVADMPREMYRNVEITPAVFGLESIDNKSTYDPPNKHTNRFTGSTHLSPYACHPIAAARARCLELIFCVGAMADTPVVNLLSAGIKRSPGN